ncbi:MAG: heat-inducible transcription repressor HrcA [Nitrospinae bacterium]|nr:heat-inducible transcription repressor HrcA [Nitrospinota bacterium]
MGQENSIKKGDGLDGRAAMVLKAVVESFALSGEPVGSRAISKNYGFNLCPASIRNVMADLEEGGFIFSPHTSAGREPSDKGYRYYVDALVAPTHLPENEMENIRDAAHGAQWREVAELLASVSRTLASLSRQASLIGIVSWGGSPIKKIKFVGIDDTRIMAVSVFQGGDARTQLIRACQPYTQDELDKLSNFFNDNFAGMTLDGIKRKLAEELTGDRKRVDSLMRQAAAMAALMEGEGDASTEAFIHVDGASNLLEGGGKYSMDITGMRAVFRAFDEKSKLVSLLNRCLKGDGVSLVIGSEAGLDGFSDFTLVTHGFHSPEGAMGGVGIIGPKTLDYGRAMSLVAYAARQVTERFNG